MILSFVAGPGRDPSPARRGGSWAIKIRSRMTSPLAEAPRTDLSTRVLPLLTTRGLYLRLTEAVKKRTTPTSLDRDHPSEAQIFGKLISTGFEPALIGMSFISTDVR